MIFAASFKPAAARTSATYNWSSIGNRYVCAPLHRDPDLHNIYDVEVCIPFLFDVLAHRSLHFEALKEFKDLVEIKGSASGKWPGMREFVK